MEKNSRKININDNNEVVGVPPIFDNSGRNSLPLLLSPKQAADLLQVSVNTIYQWSSQGKLDHCKGKLGKYLYLHRDRLLAELFSRPKI